MQKILLNVSYSDESGKCWSDSCIKNKIVSLIDNDIHKTITETISSCDCMEMSYNGKPQGNIYTDVKNGNPKIIGYHYRCKCPYIEKEDRSGCTTGYFTAWVRINKVEDFELENIDA